MTTKLEEYGIKQPVNTNKLLYLLCTYILYIYHSLICSYLYISVEDVLLSVQLHTTHTLDSIRIICSFIYIFILYCTCVGNVFPHNLLTYDGMKIAPESKILFHKTTILNCVYNYAMFIKSLHMNYNPVPTSTC